MINERLKVDDKKYQLVDKNEDQCKFFKELNTYIPKLLFFYGINLKLFQKYYIIQKINQYKSI